MASAVDTGVPEGFVLIEPAPDPNAIAAATTGVPEGFDIVSQPNAPQEEGPGFFDRIGERLGERADIFREITAAPPESNLESAGKGLQVLGNVVAGGALDVAGEVVATGFGTLIDVAGAITPDSVEQPVVDKVGEIFDGIVGTKAVQAAIGAASQGVEAYNEFAEANPGAAKNIAAAANLALLVIPAKGKPKPKLPPGPGIAGRAAERVGDAAKTQEAKRRSDFINNLVRPADSKRTRETEILRTTPGEGFFSKPNVAPSTAEKGFSEAVGSLTGVKESNTLLQNLKQIQRGIEAEAKTLVSALKQNSVRIPRQGTKQVMEGVIEKLAKNPLLVGDAAKTGERVVRQARSILANHPNTPLGVLRARQDFDKWVASQRPKVFDPATESALSIAVRETRQTMNNIIEVNAPGAAVRDSLNKQSNLFGALENLAPKAANEAKTVLGRAVNNITAAVGAESKLAKAAASIIGTGALGGAIFVPGALEFGTGVAATVLAVKGTKAAVTSSSTKKGLRQLLSLTDRAIVQAKGSPELAKKLRLDRAAIIEILNSLGQKEPQK